MLRTSLGAHIAKFSSFLELSENGETIHCSVCDLTFQCNRKRDINRHISSKKHADNLQSSSDSEFFSELCKVFVSANIPFHKLQNVELKNFLEKHCDRKIPGESNLRKHYLSPMFEKKMEEIREAVKDKFLWVNVEETTDAQGHSIGNIIVGTLHVSTPTSHYLVASKLLEETDSETMFSLVCNSLDNITSEKSSKVLLLVTDASSHMLKAGGQLSEEMPQMIHITCLDHALQQVCDYIKEGFSEVDKFVNEIKNILFKSPSRQKLFNKICPHLQLSPQPLLIRWGAWLEAVSFYSDNFNDIQHVIFKLENTSKSIEECKKLIKRPQLAAELNLIKEHYGHISLAIAQLETQNMSLPDALDLFNNTIDNLKFSGDFQKRLDHLLKTVILKQNSGYKKICEISKVLKNEVASEELFQYYRYAPVTSRNVEHSFSTFKKGCSPKRHFTSDNMEKYFILYYNSKNDV